MFENFYKKWYNIEKLLEKGDVMRKNSFLPVYIIIVVIFILSAGISIYTIGLEGSNNDKRVNTLLAARVYDVINNNVSRAIIMSDSMSNNSFLIEDLQNEDKIDQKQFEENVSKYLKNVRDDMHFATAFLISDQTKRYYTHNGLKSVLDVENNTRDFWYPKFLYKNKKHALNVGIARHNNNAWTIFVDTRMEDKNGKLLGVVGVGLNMSDVQETLRNYSRNYDVEIHLVSPSGLVMADIYDDSITNEKIDLPEEAVNEKNGYFYEEGERGHFRIIKYLDELDWYLVIASNDTQDKYRGAYFSTVMMHIALCILMLIVVFRAMNYASQNTQRLHEASVIDGPTGLFNKRAFEELKEHLKAGNKLPPNFMVMTADLNGLKSVNDNMGHEAGDELIAGGAFVLKTVIEKYGIPYRTGGDEFMAILRMPMSELDKLKADLEKAMNEWHGRVVPTLSISYGFASSEENPDMGIEDLIKLSDSRMYAHKDEYYKRTGAKRRT